MVPAHRSVLHCDHFHNTLHSLFPQVRALDPPAGSIQLLPFPGPAPPLCPPPQQLRGVDEDHYPSAQWGTQTFWGQCEALPIRLTRLRLTPVGIEPA